MTQLLYTPRSYGRFLRSVYSLGQPVSPRGLPTWELLDAHLELKNPRDRLVTSRARRINVAFGIAEFMSTMVGVSDISWFTKFIQDYDKFSSDGKTLDGCYGDRVVYASQVPDPTDVHEGWMTVDHHQILEAHDKLLKDPDTRQAVVSIYQREDLHGLGGLNTPCTLNLQFLLRQGYLHLITTMRSNDAFKGTPYDIFQFTMIQEWMANELAVQLGTYHHNAGSLHIYQPDVEKILEIERDNRWPGLMGPMSVGGVNDLQHAVDVTWVGMRTPRKFQTTLDRFGPSEYLSGLICTMVSFAVRRDNPEVSQWAYHRIQDRTIKYVLRPWLVSAGVMSPREP